MLSIKFKPKTKDLLLVKATEEYQYFWDKEGDIIVDAIEEISLLKFKIEKLEAVVYEGISKSNPLFLRASYSSEVKKATLIHELCHILLVDNNIKIKDVHKGLYLILYDIWIKLYGNSFAGRMIEIESKRNIRYKDAWDYVLQFNKNKRSKKFLELYK